MDRFRYGGAKAGGAGVATADAGGGLSGIQSKGDGGNFLAAVQNIRRR